MKHIPPVGLYLIAILHTTRQSRGDYSVNTLGLFFPVSHFDTRYHSQFPRRYIASLVFLFIARKQYWIQKLMDKKCSQISRYSVKGLEKLLLYSIAIATSIAILKLWDSLSEGQNNRINMTAA